MARVLTSSSAPPLRRSVRANSGILKAPQKRAYAREMGVCDGYRNQSGTMYLSATAFCRAKVAQRYAQKASKQAGPSVDPLALLPQAASAALAFSAIAWNAVGSVMARSDSTLRSTVMPDFDRPLMKDAVGHAERGEPRIHGGSRARGKVRFLRLRSRKAYWPAFSTAALAARMVFAAAAETLGGLVDFLVLGVRGHTAFDARHDCYP